MNLNDYQWSHNPRGLHNAAATNSMDIDALIAMKMGWAKLVVFTTLDIKDIPRLLANNITPIVRVYVPHFGAMPPSAEVLNLYKGYFDAGVRWFELYNEPNLPDEWPPDTPPNYHNIPQTIAPLMQNWMTWAETILAWGGYPAFPALTEAATADASAPLWLDATLAYLRDNALDRFRNIAGNGMWVATHAGVLNHFYQEVPGHPNQPRPIDQQNGMDGGWHFEYPSDPVSQALDPGRTVFGGTPHTPYGDPNGLIAMGTAFMTRFQSWFGGGTVPVVSTEGGIMPVPSTGDQQPDGRFQPYSRASHAEATVAMFNWISTVAPAWMFGLCMWKEDDYLHGPGGALPAVDRLAHTNPVIKSVAALPTLGARPSGTPVIPTPAHGPGPVHGVPDLHVVVLSADFNPDWFFDAAHNYWDRFQPTLLTTFDLFALLPNTKSLAITLLSTPTQAAPLSQLLKNLAPNIFLDVISVDSPEALTQLLRGRIDLGRRFG